jgi:thymidylate synthase (FAD)
MKIIKQSYEILDYPESICQTIEKAGRTCYQSQNKITNDSAGKFVKMLLDRGHEAMIEFGDITVKFITNRGVTHELVRHRLCSFAQESTRYVKYNGDMEFIEPVWSKGDLTGSYKNFIHRRGNELDQMWLLACGESEIYYQTLLKSGWKAQQAREVLPNSLKTEIVMKGNIREWRHIFKLRCAKTAHPQMYSLMRPLLHELRGLMPVIFDDIKY